MKPKLKYGFILTILMKSKMLIANLAIFIITLAPVVFSSGCVVYFTGIGCPHCARADPVVIGSALNGTPIVIEYEVYHNANYNARVFEDYAKKYGLELGIPTIVFENGSIVGDRDVISKMSSVRFGRCPTLNGYKDFRSLNLSTLPGRPKVWLNGMVLIRTGGSSNETQVKMVLNHEFDAFERVQPEPVALSGRSVYFKNAVKIQGWIVEYETSEHKNDRTTAFAAILIILIISIMGWKKWKH